MSDSFNRMQKYIDRLRESAKVVKKDVRQRLYAGYINQFIGEFCNEKVYLVGSTGENLKLRWSKDGGDTDFLLCTGMFEIPVENLVFRRDTPCYVWVKAEGVNSAKNLDLVDNRYLPADLLRSVSPELFTFLRGIYLIVTSSLETVKYRPKMISSTGLPSRVGLARTEYSNLKIQSPCWRKAAWCCLCLNKPKMTKNYGTDFAIHNERLRTNVEIHNQDKEIMDMIISMIVANKPGSSGSNDSKLGNLYQVMNIVQMRRERSQATASREFEGVRAEGATESHEASVQEHVEGNLLPEVTTRIEHSTTNSLEEFKQKRNGVVATYDKKTSEDFVPAIRVKGMLKFMADWEKRNGFWPKAEDRHRISKCDVFVVSRNAPIAPDLDKDFCLSFNLAEVELAKCMSQVQRDVFLILKSYLKGGFQAMQDTYKPQTELKLKTYHLKMALYWISEREDSDIWQKSNIKKALLKVLQFIAEAVDKRHLDHYFNPENNLFAGFLTGELHLIRECISQAIADPISYIQHFFNLDDGKRMTIKLTKEELNTLLETRKDGGLEKQADSIEEAIRDFHRGLNAGPRDVNMNAPILSAIEKTGESFLQDLERGELTESQETHDLAGTRSRLTALLRAPMFRPGVTTENVLSTFNDLVQLAQYST